MHEAAELISALYFDGHQVLRRTPSRNGYNLLADEKGVERIDMQSIESLQGPTLGNRPTPALYRC
jgi:hypothetical protein